jgi:hypothetical protein
MQWVRVMQNINPSNKNTNYALYFTINLYYVQGQKVYIDFCSVSRKSSQYYTLFAAMIQIPPKTMTNEQNANHTGIWFVNCIRYGAVHAIL